MDGQDMLKDLTEACHRNGIRVMVRVDFRGVEKERYEERPDWFAEDKDGGPVVDWGFLYKPCYNSYFANEHAEEFITRMMENYAIDASGRILWIRNRAVLLPEMPGSLPQGNRQRDFDGGRLPFGGVC